jgi:hypothetical protein
MLCQYLFDILRTEPETAEETVRAAVLRITLFRQGGENHEPDKEPGDAFVGHLAHRDGLIASGYPSNSSHRYDTRSACYRCRCFDPNGSVRCSVRVEGQQIGCIVSDIMTGTYYRQQHARHAR